MKNNGLQIMYHIYYYDKIFSSSHNTLSVLCDCPTIIQVNDRQYIEFMYIKFKFHPPICENSNQGGLAISTRKASHIDLQVSCISNCIHMTPGESFYSIFTLSINNDHRISDLQWNMSKGLTPWCNDNQAVYSLCLLSWMEIIKAEIMNN